MVTQTHLPGPAHRWRQDAAHPAADPHLRLRLAAMAGHMLTDHVAARRAALIDLLAEGRPVTRADIIGRIANELGDDCWGARPAEALLRDTRALRRGGVRVAYSRQPGLEGYYLAYPALDMPDSGFAEAADREWTTRIRAMGVPDKLAAAFAVADFALRQKRLILREEWPRWPAERVEQEARRLVFGVSSHE